MKKETESQAKPTQTKKTTKPSNLKRNLLIAGGLVTILVAYLGFQNYQFQQESAKRREAAQAQQQVLIEKWQADGLTEAEIQSKLEEERGSFQRGDFQPSTVQQIMRTVRRATGTGGRGPGGGR